MQLQKYPEYLCTFFSVFVIHPVVFSGGIVEGQIFSMHFGNFISAMRATPQSGKAHTVRDDLVEAGRASEKRTVGSPGRLHHAAQSVWTHNVRPARKTGCRSWGCKQSRPLPRAVRAAKLCPRCSPSPGCELQIRRKKIIATILATTKGKNLNFKRA